MMSPRLIALIIVVAACLGVRASPVAGSPTNAIAIDPASLSIAPGASGRVSVTIDVGESLGHWNIDVGYDASVLSVDTCTAAPEGLCNVQFGPGTVRFVGATGDPDGLAGHVVLGTIDFIALGQEDDQTTLHPTVNELGNAAADPIDSTTADGLVTIHAPTPSPTASPAPGDGGASSFSGLACLDLDCSGAASKVAALINGIQCAEATIPIVVDGPVNETFYFISVPSTGQITGCGTEGASVSFTVNGRLVKQTGVWHSGAFLHMDIWAGEDFAAFSGGLSINGQPVSIVPDLPALKAFIGNVQCGERRVSPGFAPGATSVSQYLLLIVRSEASRAGCGREGATVTFTINGLPAAQTAAWAAGFHTQELSLTSLPLHKDSGNIGGLPNVGGPPGGGGDGGWSMVLAGAVMVATGGMAMLLARGGFRRGPTFP